MIVDTLSMYQERSGLIVFEKNQYYTEFQFVTVFQKEIFNEWLNTMGPMGQRHGKSMDMENEKNAKKL